MWIIQLILGCHLKKVHIPSFLYSFLPNLCIIISEHVCWTDPQGNFSGISRNLFIKTHFPMILDQGIEPHPPDHRKQMRSGRQAAGLLWRRCIVCQINWGIFYGDQCKDRIQHWQGLFGYSSTYHRSDRNLTPHTSRQKGLPKQWCLALRCIRPTQSLARVRGALLVDGAAMSWLNWLQ